MIERAKWDHTYGFALEVMPNSDEPHHTVKIRFEDEQVDSVVEWIDVVSHYPDDYLPDFPELLGPAEYVLEEDGLVHKYFNHSDFSVTSVRAVVEDRANAELEAALRPTDFYVIREIETGTKIPQNIAIERNMARQKANEIKQNARSAQPDALANLDARIPQTRPERKWNPPAIDMRPANPPGNGGGPPGEEGVGRGKRRGDLS